MSVKTNKYQKTVWANDVTPLSDENLNKIENQIELVTNEVINIQGKDIVELKNRAEFYYEIIQ